MLKKLNSVSIVIPAHNEEACLPAVLRDMEKTRKKLKGIKNEVIVVDDNSTDKTYELAKQFNFVKVIKNPGINGKGKALKVGFAEAQYDIVIMLDADYSHITDDVLKFIKKINEGNMLVIGSRYSGGSDEYTIVRAVGNYLLTLAFRIVWGLKISDVLNGYKGFRKEVVKNYNYTSRGYEVEIELVANAMQEGGPIAEFPSHERERAGGIMKSEALREGAKFLIAILKWGFRYRLGFLKKNKRIK